jgi:hypothetical protein
MMTQPFGEDLDIHVYKNFLSEDELLYLDSQILKGNQNSEWEGETKNTVDSGNWTNRNLFMERTEFVTELELKVLREYSKSVSYVDEKDFSKVFKGLGPINRTEAGQGLPVHDDMGPPELNLPVAHGLVLYLNDDFAGGNLYYPNLGLEIKPERGLLVIHSALNKYSHGVTPVESGVRYGLTMFIDSLPA